MTLDQKIQVWNAVGTWFAGIATFLAVVMSLYLARKADAIKIKANVGIRLVFAGDGTPAEEHVAFSVVNLGDRPVNVVSVGWSVGKRKKNATAYNQLLVNTPNNTPSYLPTASKRPFWFLLMLRQTGQRTLPVGSLKILTKEISKPCAHL